MLSQTAEYALRAAVWLASHHGELVTAHQVADATQVPLGYLHKILHSMTRAGLVRTQRGPGGGCILELPPEEISVLDVINSVDPIRRVKECPLGLETHGGRLCPLHRRLDDLISQVEGELARCSIADLANEPAGRPLCLRGRENRVLRTPRKRK